MTLGFRDVRTFCMARVDWRGAHFWAILLMTYARILQSGGIQALHDSPFYLMYMASRRRQPSSPDPSPAQTFEIVADSVMMLKSSVDRAANPNARTRGWMSEEIQKDHDEWVEELKERYQERYSGYVTVALIIKGVSSLETMRIPFLNRTSTPPPNNLKAILEDLVTLLRGCVNAGLALRFIEDVDYASEEEELMAQALPGRIVRRGTWTWEPLFLDWDELTPTHQAYETLHPIVAQMTSGLSPRYACSNHFAMHVL